MRTHLNWLLFTLALTCSFAFWHIHRDLRQLKKKTNAYGTLVANLDNGVWNTPSLLGGMVLPLELQNIPLGEKKGVVLRSKEINIRNVVAPYNPSIIENEIGYLLFFRYDVINQMCNSGFYTYIGCAQLDKNFDQTEEEYTIIDTGSKFSEDPRIVRTGDDVYLFFNDEHPCGRINGRTMRVAKIDLKDRTLDYTTNLDLQIQHIEKNWVPFEYIGENNKAELYIEYFMNPHKILKLADPRVNSIEHLSFPETSAFQRLSWPKIWGAPRGGSAARKIGDQYLSFFHSSFTDRRGNHWYLMGAYSFEAKAPFRITKISHYPILFEGIYTTPYMNTACNNKQIIYPTGFCFEEKDGKNLIHVTCGENDCAIKVVTIDQTELLKSLKSI